MALATTAKFEELVLELEGTTSPATYARICGMINVTVSRAAQVDEVEVPDCDNESLPLSVERQVRSVSVTISGTGIWAQESHEDLMDWFYSSAARNVRIGHLNAGSGDTEYETGSALLTKLDHSREKGKKVAAEITIVFDGTPTRT